MLLLVGCVPPPTLEEMKNADYGTKIKQQDAEDWAKRWMDSRLKDPYSAKYRFDLLHQGFIQFSQISGGKVEFGYGLNLQVNAKNSFGAYTGYKRYYLLFKNKKAVGYCEKPDDLRFWVCGYPFILD